MENTLAINGDKVVLLSKQIRSVSLNLSNVPHLIKQIIEEKMWRSFQHPSAGQVVDNSHLSFSEFVSAEPPTGLGSDLKTVENILVIQTRSSERSESQIAHEALDCFIREISVEAKTVSTSDLPDSAVDEISRLVQNSPRSLHDSPDLRRLKKNRPDLYYQVTEGQISTNRAMIEAGFRKQRFSIPQDDVSLAANTIRKRFSDQQVAQLIQHLQG